MNNLQKLLAALVVAGMSLSVAPSTVAETSACVNMSPITREEHGTPPTTEPGAANGEVSLTHCDAWGVSGLSSDRFLKFETTNDGVVVVSLYQDDVPIFVGPVTSSEPSSLPTLRLDTASSYDIIFEGFDVAQKGYKVWTVTA